MNARAAARALARLPLDGFEAASYANAVAQSLRDTRLVADLPVTGRSEFRTALARALAGALTGSQTAREALQAASQSWREIVGKIGAAKIRDDYRINLGLGNLALPRSQE